MLGCRLGACPVDVADRRVLDRIEALTRTEAWQSRVPATDPLVVVPYLVAPIGKVAYPGAQMVFECAEQLTSTLVDGQVAKTSGVGAPDQDREMSGAVGR